MNKWLSPLTVITASLRTVSIVFFCSLAIASSAFAQSDPHQVVESTTAQVIELLESGLDPTADPEAFITELSAVLDPVVAFEYIAKGVMGTYAKQASDEQLSQFTEAFKKGLVNTYGRGVSGFRGLKISVVPPEQPVGDARRATVVQEITSSGAVTKVAYTMAKNRQGQWKLINLVINGINFGQTFRGQFAASVQANDGDLDKTIANWEKGLGIL